MLKITKHWLLMNWYYYVGVKFLKPMNKSYYDKFVFHAENIKKLH
jgi:hypothetical protein